MDDLEPLIFDNNAELAMRHAAVKYEWFQWRVVFACVYPTTSWSDLIFVLSPPAWEVYGDVLTENKQKDEHNVSAHKRCYSEEKGVEWYSTFHHWIFTKTRILRHEGGAGWCSCMLDILQCNATSLAFRPRDLKQFLHPGADKHQLLLKGTQKITLLHTAALSRSWLWVWIHSQGVCFLFTVPRAPPSTRAVPQKSPKCFPTPRAA